MKTYSITYEVNNEQFSDYVLALNKEEAKTVFLKKCSEPNPTIIFVTEV